MFVFLIGTIYDQCIYMFHPFLFEFCLINPVMHSKKARTIVGMSISIATWEIYNYFLKKKVGFLYYLINGKQNI